MEQDFSRRMAIIVRRDLPGWQQFNAAAHVAAQLGNKLPVPFDTGEYFVTKDGVQYPRNSQYPIIIFAADEKDIKPRVAAIRASGVQTIFFIREMIETNDDTELQRLLDGKTEEEIEYMAVGVFGLNEEVKTLTKGLSLWK